MTDDQIEQARAEIEAWFGGEWTALADSRESGFFAVHFTCPDDDMFNVAWMDGRLRLWLEGEAVAEGPSVPDLASVARCALEERSRWCLNLRDTIYNRAEQEARRLIREETTGRKRRHL